MASVRNVELNVHSNSNKRGGSGLGVGLRCWWCRDTVEPGAEVRCPLEHHPARISRKYFSHITRDVYTIAEAVSQSKLSHVQSEEADDVRVLDAGGAMVYDEHTRFCSYNCTLAYIREHHHKVKYRMSLVLFYDMLDRDGVVGTVNSAPPLHRLAEYGGEQTLHDFKRGFVYPPRPPSPPPSPPPPPPQEHADADADADVPKPEPEPEPLPVPKAATPVVKKKPAPRVRKPKPKTLTLLPNQLLPQAPSNDPV